MGLSEIPASALQALAGAMRARIYQNQHIGIPPTLFYDIDIPLAPFDSGLDYEDQPVDTSLSMEFLHFSERDWRHLEGQAFRIGAGELDGSIYLGLAHNPIEVNRMRFTARNGLLFDVDCDVTCCFEHEKIAKNARVQFRTQLAFRELWVDRSIVSTANGIRKSLAKLVSLRAYEPVPRLSYEGIVFEPRP